MATSASRATSTSLHRYAPPCVAQSERVLTHPRAVLHSVSIAPTLRVFLTAHTAPRARRTNVTLVTGSNYQVVFIDPANTTIVYATSGTFSVDAPGSKSISSSFAFLNGGGDATRTPDAQHVYPAGFSKCSVGTRFEPRPAIHGIKSLYRAQCDLTHLLLASPAPSVSPSGSGSASGSASASGSGASHSGASASGSGSGASTTNTQNAAVPALGVSAGGVVGVIAACGIASLSALLL